MIDYFLPQGMDISQTTANLIEIDEHVRGLEGVTSTNLVVGGGHARFMLVYESEDQNPAYGQILVDVEDYRMIDALRPELQAWIDETFPSSNAKVWKFVLGPGGGSKIEARFFGPDAVVLRGLAEQAKAVFAEEGAVAIKDDWREQVQLIRPVINTENARRLGLTQGEISNALYAHLEGARIGIYREGDELLDIVMRPFEADRNGSGPAFQHPGLQRGRRWLRADYPGRRPFRTRGRGGLSQTDRPATGNHGAIRQRARCFVGRFVLADPGTD